MTWTLIVFFYAGMMADGDSVAVTNVPGFTTAQQCQQARAASEAVARGTKKVVHGVCVQVGK